MQNIDIYYESIRQVYEQILNWPKRKQPLHEKIIDGILGGLYPFVKCKTTVFLGIPEDRVAFWTSMEYWDMPNMGKSSRKAHISTISNPQKWIKSKLVVVVFLLVFSAIPALPILITVIGSQLRLSVVGLSITGFTLETFTIVWLVMIVAGLILFGIMVWINVRVDSRAAKPIGPPQTLSPEQLTFVAMYEAYKELKVYFVSHVERHVHNSFEALQRVLAPRGAYREYIVYRLKFRLWGNLDLR